jgi:hypothetical protein
MVPLDKVRFTTEPFHAGLQEGVYIWIFYETPASPIYSAKSLLGGKCVIPCGNPDSKSAAREKSAVSRYRKMFRTEWMCISPYNTVQFTSHACKATEVIVTLRQNLRRVTEPSRPAELPTGIDCTCRPTERGPVTACTHAQTLRDRSPTLSVNKTVFCAADLHDSFLPTACTCAQMWDGG